jgi:hypothetical protein
MVNVKEYGSPKCAGDDQPIHDPAANTISVSHVVRDPLSLCIGHAATEKPAMPSAYWDDRQIRGTRVDNHNMMIALKGRVWLTAAVRGAIIWPSARRPLDHRGCALINHRIIKSLSSAFVSAPKGGRRSHRKLSRLRRKTPLRCEKVWKPILP